MHLYNILILYDKPFKCLLHLTISPFFFYFTIYCYQHLILFYCNWTPAMSQNNEKDLIYEEAVILPNSQLPLPQQSGSKLSQYLKLINLRKKTDNSNIHQKISTEDNKLPQIEYEGYLQLKDYFWKHHEIYYGKDSYKEKMEIAFQFKTDNYEAMGLSVQYGNFNLNINVINVDENSNSGCLDLIAGGSFGNVYKAQVNQHKIAIKKIEIQENRFQQVFKFVVKEYFFLKIASTLEIGPKLLKIYGFDIVIFRDSIEFTMEYCKFDSSKKHNLEIDLKSSLSLLHKLNIVHRDIKPENIGYSAFNKRYIFLDFGLSSNRKQSIGEKTLTKFVGTVNYCSKQMKQLFMKEESGFIDLYYQDALSLQRSIEALQQEPVEQRISTFQTQQFQNLNNLQKKGQYYEHQKLFVFKCILNNYAVGKFQKSFELMNFQRTMLYFTQEIFEFLINLPQTRTLNWFYQNYVKNKSHKLQQIFNTNINLLKYPHRAFINQSQLFTQRYHLIKALNDFQLQQQENERIHSAENLSNKEIIAKYDRSSYIMNVIKYIKLNGETNNFEDKIRVCKAFAKPQSNNQTQSLKIYKNVILDIFQYAFGMEDVKKINILKHCIQTVVILQLIPQQKVIQTFKAVLNSSLFFIKKMTLIFEFVIAIEFTKEKYKTIYNFEELTQAFMIQLNNFLDTIIKEKSLVQIEKDIFSRLKEIANQKLQNEDQIKSKQSLFSLIEQKKQKNKINQGKVLLQTIQTYMVYYEAVMQNKNQCKRSHDHIRHFISQLDKLQFLSSQFSYIRFLHYQIAYFQHQQELTYAIYFSFHLQFSHFEEAQHFKMYFMNRVVRFNGKLKQINSKMMMKSDQSKLKQFQKYIFNSKSQLQAIFNILQYIIDNSREYHFFLQLVFFVNTLNQSIPTFKSYSIEFIRKNKVKLVSLTDVFHKNGSFYHTNYLKCQIMITKNMISLFKQFELADNAQVSHKQHFIKECYKKIQKSNCFTCKVSCNIEVKLIEAQLLVKEQKYEQFVDLLSQLIAINFKYTQLYGQLVRVVITLVKEWQINKQIYQKYHITEFIYRYTKDFKDFSICFTSCEFYSIFIDQYLHILNYYGKDEILEFLSNILAYIEQYNFVRIINTFYYNLLHFIKLDHDKKFRRYSKLSHNSIVNQILSDRRFKNNPYVSLYFSALLQIRVRGVLDKIMLKFIIQNLRFMDNHSKNLIISNLHSQAAFYEQHSIRKLRFLNNKHIKHSISMFTLTFILKVKLKSNKRKVKNSKFVKKLAKYIEKYHRHKIQSKDQCQQSYERQVNNQ